MAVTARSVSEALRRAIGAERVLTDPAALGAAAIDGCTPRWIARPRAADDVAALLAIATEERLAVTPRGSGSSLTLGHPPARLDIVLDLRDLDAVVEYNPDDLTVTVQAGVTAAALAERLAPRHQWLPLDPAGSATRTVGGIVATNGSGPLRARYGTARDLLLGVRFVQADGVSTWGGARVVKSVSGYDIPKLMVGSLGTLGVLVELTARLHPMPETEATRLVTFPAVRAAQAFVARVLDSTVQPHCLEILNAAVLDACDVPRAPAAVAVSVGSVKAAVRAAEARLTELAGADDGTSTAVGADFWQRYDAAMPATTYPVVLNVGTLTSMVGDTVREAERLFGGDAGVAGCAPAGVVRIGVPSAAVHSIGAGVRELRALVAENGGGVVIERGPRDVRDAVDPWGTVEPGSLALMRALKAEFDPLGVLNPGRFVGGM
jgi:glycolate oxidase FAD binding subunit